MDCVFTIHPLGEHKPYRFKVQPMQYNHQFQQLCRGKTCKVLGEKPFRGYLHCHGLCLHNPFLYF